MTGRERGGSCFPGPDVAGYYGFIHSRPLGRGPALQSSQVRNPFWGVLLERLLDLGPEEPASGQKRNSSSSPDFPLHTQPHGHPEGSLSFRAISLPRFGKKKEKKVEK